MVKWGIVVVLLVFVSIDLLAQSCTTDPLYQDSTYGVWPDPEINLPHAVKGIYYETVIQIKVPVYADEVDPSMPAYPVNWVKVDSIGGLPAGFNYTTNGINNTWQNGEQGCALIYGSTDTGTFPLIMYLSGEVQAGIFLVDFDEEISDYRIVVEVDTISIIDTIIAEDTLSIDSFQSPEIVDTTVGLSFNSKPELMLSIYPNPFNNYLVFRGDFNSGKTYQLSVFNILGQSVLSVKSSLNKMVLNTSDWNKGIYNFRIEQDNKINWRRIIKQ